MTTLYDLADLRERLDVIFADQDGEITPEQEAQLDAIEGAFAEKTERVALYVVEQLSRAKSIKAEEERLAQRRRGYESRADWLKNYLHRCLDTAGKTKVEGLLATVALQNNPPSVQPVVAIDEADLRNLAMIAPSFVRHEELWSLDKRAVLDAHKAGTLPDDIAKRVQIVQTRSVRIR